jgi:hypothetical protein
MEVNLEAMGPYEHAALDGPLGLILERADEPDVAEALAAGRKMSDQDAAAYALASATASAARLE